MKLECIFEYLFPGSFEVYGEYHCRCHVRWWLIDKAPYSAPSIFSPCPVDGLGLAVTHRELSNAPFFAKKINPRSMSQLLNYILDNEDAFRRSVSTPSAEHTSNPEGNARELNHSS